MFYFNIAVVLQYVNQKIMTKSEIVQHVKSNYWLVTEQVANSFHALITSNEGISINEILARRAAYDARYGTKVFSAGKKKLMPYKSGKKKTPRTDSEIYSEEEHDDDDDNDDDALVTAEGIAVVHIKGLIQKDSDYCTRGTDEINSELIELGENPRIKGVILYVDSGGGQVAGTEQLANTVYNFKRRFNKRIEAVVDTAGSAAYWIASGCDKIHLSGNTSCAGSIGTMATIVNMADYEAMIGVQVFNIYATLSTNKNKEYSEAQEGRPELMRTEVLDKLNSVFLGAVIRGRYRNTYNVDNLTPDSVPEQLTGKIYFGKDAISIGLADGIATLEEVLIAFDSKLPKEDDTQNPAPFMRLTPNANKLTALTSLSKP